MPSYPFVCFQILSSSLLLAMNAYIRSRSYAQAVSGRQQQPPVKATVESPLIDGVVYDTSKLRLVTHVMDIDGYFVDGHFHPKEVAVIDVRDETVHRFDVLLPYDISEASEHDRQTIEWTVQNIHGMPWSNDVRFLEPGPKHAPSSVRPKWCTPYTLSARLYDWLLSTSPDRPLLVAYKGGRLEADLLNDIGVESIDLEVYGCPKVDTLVTQGVFPQAFRGFEDDPSQMARAFVDDGTAAVVCDNHREFVGNGTFKTTNKRSGKPTTTFHCPVVECLVFKRWIDFVLSQSQN